ncbi:MAG: prolyl oligopeptidase family serine peptidase [Candidatus Neomarinimicrobiota bacterium]
MLITALLLAILLITLIIWRKPLARLWRMIMFGLSILSDGKSRIVRWFTGPIEFIETTYPDAAGDLPIKIYQPLEVTRPLPAVILYHGITAKGIDHPAINLLARNLVRLGLRVYYPALPHLRDMRFHPDTYQRIKNIYRQVAARPEVLSDKIIITGISFSGGLVVKAGTDPDIRPAAILSFGSYYNLATVLRFFFTGQARYGDLEIRIEPHDYTKAVWFWNYLEYLDLPFETDRVRQCIGLFIRDDKAAADEIYRACSAAQQEFLTAAFEPADPRALPYLEAAEPRLREQLDAISPHTLIANVKAPVFVVHGIRDDMVPYTQALEFADDLKKHGKTVCLYIMRLYAHNKAARSTIAEAIREIRGLNGILTNLLKILE